MTKVIKKRKSINYLKNHIKITIMNIVWDDIIFFTDGFLFVFYEKDIFSILLRENE
jgi:hypothetical protein